MGVTRRSLMEVGIAVPFSRQSGLGRGVAPAQTEESDGVTWSMYAAGPGNNTYKPDLQGPRTELTHEWSFSDMEARGKHAPYAPVVADGRAYFGDGGQYVYAVDLADGSLVWKENLDIGIQNSPAIYDGGLYVVTFDGRMYELDLETGETRSYLGALPSGADSPELTTSIAVADGVLVSRSYADLVGVDVESQSVRWRKRDARISHNPAPAFAIGDGLIAYRTGEDAALTVADLRTGEVRWRAKTGYGGQFASQFTVANWQVYAPSHAFPNSGPDMMGIHAFDLADGTRRWEHLYEQSAAGSQYPIVTEDGVSYTVQGWYGLDGEERSAPEGILEPYAVSDGQRLYAFDRFSADFAVYEMPGSFNSPIHYQQLALQDGIASAPVVMDNAVLYGGDGTLRYYESDPPERTPTVTSTPDRGGNGGDPDGSWPWWLLVLLLPLLWLWLLYRDDEDEEADEKPQ